MSDLVTPAPVIRRLAAAVYDGLMFLALLLASLLISVILRDALGFDAKGSAWNRYCSGLAFSVGLLFFGWFWTHGGQTVGMLAWRLRVRREDGSPLRWPVAAIRYAGMLLCWLVALIPLLSLLPDRIIGGGNGVLIIFAIVITALGLISMILDGRKRAPHDRISSCEVVLLPPKTASYE